MTETIDFVGGVSMASFHLGGKYTPPSAAIHLKAKSTQNTSSNFVLMTSSAWEIHSSDIHPRFSKQDQ